MLISPTKLLTESLLIAKEGSQLADHTGRCVMCGAEYHKGEIVEPFAPADSFTEYADLQNPTGTHICGACKAVWRKEFMQSYTKNIVSKDGLFPFFSNNDVAYWLKNPPAPPFMMFISTQQLGHVIWKVPVSLSRDVFFVRYDDKVFAIRHARLMEGLEAANLIDAALKAKASLQAGQDTKKKKKEKLYFESPFVLDRNLERSSHGFLKDAVVEMAQDDPAVAGAVAVLRSLNAGEIWALPHFFNADSTLTRPEPKLAPGQFA